MNEESNLNQDLIFKLTLLYILWSGMIVSFPSMGQEGSFITTMGGFEHIASRDIGMSPLMYAGSGFFAGISWEKNSEKKEFNIAVNFSKGLQHNRYESYIQYNKGSLLVYNFYHKNKSSTNQLQWGWFMNNVFSHRYNPEYVNFMDHYEYFTNLGPAAKYLLPFQVKGREFNMEGLAHMQAIGMIIRPSYTSSYPDGFLDQGNSIIQRILNSAIFSHPGNTWNFGFTPRLRYLLNSGNSLSVGYQYEFYKLYTPNPVSQSNGIWVFGLSTRLK
jgi:hypothetical protein